MPVIGAHVSVAGGLDQVLPRARRIGAEAVQIFPSNPRQWRPFSYPQEAVRAFGAELAAAGVPLFLHTIYLINLASPDAVLRHRSSEAVADVLRFGAWAAAAGVVTHVGSHRGDGMEAAGERVAEALCHVALEVAADVGISPPLLLETGSGGRGSVGNNPAELGWLMNQVGNQLPLGVCLDTAHLFAAGYPAHTAAGVSEVLDEVVDAMGASRVGLVHLNDSASEQGSRRDRHANLWTGYLGREGLAAWLHEPRLQQVPFVLETPGFEGKGPDRRNLWRAKKLRSGSDPGASGARSGRPPRE